eukprot:TRINITY_DN7313_c0_g1_i2.p3 TRINITY_DN7313_c0_g1~~TRINITY_DN7313_c0_g1_i2.p3  ORF type:complete len:95 (+),score=2.58 TRINITY_DN7313_c0_g1_i2:184-468(+)
MLRYRVDTSNGNSGSAIFDETNQLAIGVHTLGGCNVNIQAVRIPDRDWMRQGLGRRWLSHAACVPLEIDYSQLRWCVRDVAINCFLEKVKVRTA